MKANAMKMAEGVYWVGVIDWDIRNYHGYTLEGTTYNCYMIFGEYKVALIDNSYPGTSGQLWGRINDVFEKEGRKPQIDVIIQNHVEKDHSGTLVEVIKKFPEAEIYCTDKAVNGLKNHYPQLEKVEMNIVKTGDSLDLGGKTLAFVEAPMIHWPDSMFTLLAEEGILFSNDAFGQHLCTTQRYDHEIPENVLMEASQKFYANLVTPLSPLVMRKFAEVTELGVLEQIKQIAPSHGVIITDPGKMINAYTGWATGKCKDKITIVYDTMHYSTQKMAHSLAEGAMSENVEVVMYFLAQDERSEIVKDILDSKALLLGSPTIYNGPYPSLGDMIYYLTGLSFNRTGIKRLAGVFGSKGWGGGATRKLSQDLEQCGFEVVETLDIDYIPSEENLDKCYEMGKSLAKKIKEM
jgi:flavorubredoxin